MAGLPKTPCIQLYCKYFMEFPGQTVLENRPKHAPIVIRINTHHTGSVNISIRTGRLNLIFNKSLVYSSYDRVGGWEVYARSKPS